ncbi:gliding motility-associated C-terminal domain-containing protein [Chitinophaga nivalis]|uniref:Gliding motility-associated C-terminal domain-containing protein n=1 Tax=Chitinophaga nivalis TaxID=2991709 RepID=A0ABT3IFT4_9BACT|nr:gliding motility-associated C-terminal domain-containing protein [Chitinophaga nivalis]MCW3467491.1 gliding motility-associated C-terminal domain-containing protein [Chitinophaga nivalis]MCW3482817.1 gliding motility-associated C-terminal domain-containing protein [Chitinophaga nivalis]
MSAILLCCAMFFTASAGGRATAFTPSSTCVNDTIYFSIPAPAGIDSVKWYFGDPLSAEKDSSKKIYPYHIYTQTGTYTIRLVAWRNGKPDTTIQDIAIVSPVLYDLGPQDITLCEGNTMTLEAPVIPGATYLWQDNSTGSSILVDTASTYKVKINGCLLRDSVNVFYTPIPVIDLGPDLVLCTGEHIALDATAQNCTYQWNTGNTSPTQDVTTSGTYHVNVYPKGCAPITDEVTITFTGSPLPFTLGPDTLLCPGESITLAPKAPGATKWTWSTGATKPSVTIRSEGNVWALVEINHTCSVVDTVFVNYNRLKKLNLGNDTTLCKGNFLVLTADFGNGTYLWQDGSDQATYYVTQPGNYSVQAKIGRCEASDAIRVSYVDTLRANLGPDKLLCQEETLQLQPTGIGGAAFKWQDSTSVPVYNVTRPGIYAIVAHNACGKSVDSVQISYQDCACTMHFPTAFTPNGDGRNDYFRPIFRCPVYQYTLSIYNRWGERVFFTTDPKVGWTGKVYGQAIDAVTFVWIVDYREVNTNLVVHKTGTVTAIY